MINNNVCFYLLPTKTYIKSYLTESIYIKCNIVESIFLIPPVKALNILILGHTLF